MKQMSREKRRKKEWRAQSNGKGRRMSLRDLSPRDTELPTVVLFGATCGFNLTNLISRMSVYEAVASRLAY